MSKKELKQSDTNPINEIAERILYLNRNKGYVLPSKQNVSLLLANKEISKVLLFCKEHIEKYKENKAIKDKLKFYQMYQDKIANLYSLTEKKKKLTDLLKAKKEKLIQLKKDKELLSSKNDSILQVIHKKQNDELLSDIKCKIITIATNPITELFNSIDKYLFIENYKYDHCYFGKNNHNNAIKSHENDKPFNINEYINEASSHISLINQSSLLQQSSMSNTSKTQNNIQLVPLPKMIKEEIEQYTQFTQDEYLDEITKMLYTLSLAKDSKDKNALSLSLSSIKSNNTTKNNEILNENKSIFTSIINRFNEEIQKEEKDLSVSYNENKKNCYYNEIEEENNKLIKLYHIPQEIIKKINDVVRKKLAKDIMNEYVKFEDNIEEFILPKCIIENDTSEKISFYQNVLITYRKFLSRTDNFIIKRLFPLGILLEEKYTDFINSIQTEIDYFVKLNLNCLKKNQLYSQKDYFSNKLSLKKYKYDKNILSVFNIHSKYDLISLYFKLKDKETQKEKSNDEIKAITDIIYSKTSYVKDIKSSNDSVKGIDNFIKGYNFEQEYKIFPHYESLEIAKELIGQYYNIDHILYSNTDKNFK